MEKKKQMSDRTNPIQQAVMDAVDKGTALEARDIIALRAQSKKSIVVLNGIFWVGAAIFNVILWVPLPIEINQAVLYVVAFAVLVIALVVPILGLKKHKVNLELLRLNKQMPNRKTASEAGRAYIDQVKKQDRPFINAEFEILESINGQKRLGD